MSGHGTLTTDGFPVVVGAGCVVIAPCGTTHALRNGATSTPLSLLVVELQAPASPRQNPAIVRLAGLLHPGNAFAPVRVRGQIVQPQMATLDLSAFFRGPWGTFSLVDVPPGARVDAYQEEHRDQLVLLSGFSSALITPPEPADEIRVDATGEGFQCLVVPAGVPLRLENRASGTYTARILCLTVVR